MDSLSNLIHCCDEMPSDGVSICWGPARFGSEDLGWCLVIERVATEDDLQENQYLEEVGDTLWTTAVEINPVSLFFATGHLLKLRRAIRQNAKA